MSFKTLLAYQKAFDLAMQIFKISKGFPVEERFALTSQIVRSSRAVCATIAEAYRKRDYIKHYKSKLTDADSENAETQLWIDFALACNYISEEESISLNSQNDEIGRLINYMINNPGKFGVRDC
ncbi:four helix bundle protein [Gramella sp. MAR_2010_147]|uniref:four helix bundle protein n=1 Tax=Gramella sp. MAR_2010_147 TaxID=1250205 RepID=UPI00087BEC07|nr:four helix bundle protein [Gramella sp. MAR_2010_147]SDS57806.1 four helix bundle protein [Gramella sp. MAR_2010_147]